MYLYGLQIIKGYKKKVYIVETSSVNSNSDFMVFNLLQQTETLVADLFNLFNQRMIRNTQMKD
jgi:hypothetical protein